MSTILAYNYSEASGAVLDRSGNGRNFSLTGGSTRTAAGNGYTYGGAQPNVKGLTQSSAALQAGPSIAGLNVNPRTIATWAKAGAADPSWFLEWHRAGVDDTGVFGFLMLSGSFRGRAKNSSNTAFEVTATPDGTNWHYWAMTQDGSTLRVYRGDNNDPNSLAQVGSVAMPHSIWTADDLRIFDNSGPGVILSETRVLDTAASLAELKTLMATPVTDTETKTYFSNGQQASGIYEMTSGGLVQRNSIIGV